MLCFIQIFHFLANDKDLIHKRNKVFITEFLGDPCFQARIRLKYGIFVLSYMRVRHEY